MDVIRLNRANSRIVLASALMTIMRVTQDEACVLIDVLEKEYGISPMIMELEREYALPATIPVLLENNGAFFAHKRRRAGGKYFVPKVIGCPCRKKGKR